MSVLGWVSAGLKAVGMVSSIMGKGDGDGGGILIQENLMYILL